MFQKSATKLEENVVDFGMVSEKLLRKYKKVWPRNPSPFFFC